MRQTQVACAVERQSQMASTFLVEQPGYLESEGFDLLSAHSKVILW